MKYQIDEEGILRRFRGIYPGCSFPNVRRIEKNYIQISESKSFQKNFNHFKLCGTPNTIVFCRAFIGKIQYQDIPKREDLCHTGTHKVNNTIGQILIAQAW